MVKMKLAWAGNKGKRGELADMNGDLEAQEVSNNGNMR